MLLRFLLTDRRALATKSDSDLLISHLFLSRDDLYAGVHFVVDDEVCDCQRANNGADRVYIGISVTVVQRERYQKTTCADNNNMHVRYGPIFVVYQIELCS